MAASGFTPISLYYSTTASAVPTSGNLANGELGLNIADMKLYAKNSAGTVTLLASNAGASGSVTSVSGTGTVNGLTLTGTVTTSGSLTLGGTLSLVSPPPIGSTTPNTGAFTTLSATGNLTSLTAQFGTNPAGVSIGVIGIPNQKRIYGRNAANSADINILYVDGSNGLVLGPSDAAVIDTNGNVGIGQASIPSWTKLAVTGTAGAQTDAKQQIIINAPTTTAGEGSGIRLNAASGANEAVGIIGVVNNASGNLGSITFGVYNGGASIPEWLRINNVGAIGLSGANFGTSGQVLTSSGSGSAPTWTTPASGGGSFTAKTTNYTAASGDNILANTSAGSWTLTLPASPSTGNAVQVMDSIGTFGTYPLTVARNGQTIMSAAEDMTLAVNGAATTFVYNGSTWRVI